MQTLLCGAQVYTEQGFVKADVLISDGIVAAVVPSSLGGTFGIGGTTPDRIFELNNRYIFPGFVDVHVHLREPGFSYKEDIATGTAAAAAGGYTDVCAMPNLQPVPDSREHLNEELNAADKAIVHVHPYASLSVGEQGRELSDIEDIACDAVAFSDDGRGLADDGLMRSAMLRVKACGRLIAAHCEDMTVIGGANIHDGKTAALLGIRGISSESEWRMVARDIGLARETGCPYHVCHVSTAESVGLIRQAKAEGVDITCETGPHYLLLDEDDIVRELAPEGAGISPEDLKARAAELGRFKMNPPLRGSSDREALIEGLKDGTIDMIATDHAPHSLEEKSGGLLHGPMGVVGLECAFPVLYTGLVKTGVITLEKLVDIMTTVPAERFGIVSGIKEGNPANLCVYDLDAEYTIDPSRFASKGRFTPFEGRRVKGRCLMTVCDGEIVYRADEGGNGNAGNL